MDESKLERIEDKFDKFYADFKNFERDTCLRIQRLEDEVRDIKHCNNEQNKELKPFTNFHWLIIQIPSIVAVIASLVAILKAFGIIQ